MEHQNSIATPCIEGEPILPLHPSCGDEGHVMDDFSRPPLGRQSSRGINDPSESRAQKTDRMLIARVVCGDNAAFAEVFDRHSSLILGVLTQILRNRAEAEEILQETFLHVWRKSDRYSPQRASVRGWLIMLARSRALDCIRSNRSREAREDAHSRHTPEFSLEIDAISTLEEAERAQRIRHLLRRLPEPQRLCIRLAFFNGLSHRQIATKLNIPLGTVKSRILHGMRRIRRDFGTAREPHMLSANASSKTDSHPAAVTRFSRFQSLEASARTLSSTSAVA